MINAIKKTVRKEHYEFRITEKSISDTATPVDLSFKKISNLTAPGIGAEGARKCRVGKVPEKGSVNQKYLTKSIWLNNNRLTTITGVDTLVDSLLEEPKEVGWIDFSFNYIETIDESLLGFTSLKILYFHGNMIADLDEVFKLRALKNLRSVTFHGNPIAEHPKYRKYIVAVLPQIVNLDFSPVLKDEKYFPPPAEAMKALRRSLIDARGEDEKEEVAA